MKVKLEKNEYPTFPQADDIYKVLGYCNLVSINKLDDNFDKIRLWEYSNRQAHYYVDAARYLGLYDLHEKKLTKLGETLFALGKDELLIGVAYLILKNEIFFNFYKDHNEEETIQVLMNQYLLSMSTAKRRLTTIKNWIKWIRIVLKEEEVEIPNDSRLF